MRKHSHTRHLSPASDRSSFVPPAGSPEHQAKSPQPPGACPDGHAVGGIDAANRHTDGEITEPRDVRVSTTSDEDRDETIRRRAYMRYLQRNGGPGDAASDWLAAEEEFDARRW